MGQHMAPLIKKLRKDAGVSQKALAKKTGISVARIAGYESGNRTPGHVQIEALACVIGGGLPMRQAYDKDFNDDPVDDVRTVKGTIERDSYGGYISVGFQYPREMVGRRVVIRAEVLP